MRVTTQCRVRTAREPLTRQYRVDHLDLHCCCLHGQFHINQLFSKTTLLQGNKGGTVITDNRFTAVLPFASRKEVGWTLGDFIHKTGVLESLTANLAPEMTGSNTDFMKYVYRYNTGIHWAEKVHHWQNYRAKREIGILKQRWHKRMADWYILGWLWDYRLVYEAEILSWMLRGHDGRSGLERLTGQTPDISEWIDFTFYNLVWYYPLEKPALEEHLLTLGQWLGILHRIGSNLLYWILTEARHVILCSTVQHVTDAESKLPGVQTQIDDFTKQVNVWLDNCNHVLQELTPGVSYIKDVDIKSTEHLDQQGVIPSDKE